ncbi:MAG: sulfatase-like hydrolase/transferase [Cyclobacteriaceae bacterium]|nr:sulfatase-like hydrolase/transferase [Cyclobacteriaceae bacterium HetDA_MAG_MS6]
MKIGISLAVLLAASLTFAQESPNIILIMADDQGWNGTSVPMDPDNPDSKSDFYETPNIERLAAAGMRFSRAYAPAPKCSPTRMSILTGKTPARNQFTNTTSMVTSGEVLVEPSSTNRIKNADTTFAEVLQNANANYMSAHFGKWHIGNGGPTFHGFDDGDGATSNGDGDTGSTVNDDPKKIFELTEKGIAFMETAIAANRPFYLQLSHYAVHTGIEYTQASYDKYNAKTAGTKHDNEEFAAMTEDLDTGVGMILDFVETNNLTNSTYVIYFSDNGAQNNTSSNAPLNGSKTLLFEGGIRVPLVVSGPDIAANSHSDVPVAGYDFFPTFSEWTGVSTSDLPNNLDGVSLAELLAGSTSSLTRNTPLIFHSPHYDQSSSKEPRSTIIDGASKLLVEYESGDRLQYDLVNDIGESQSEYQASSETSKSLLLLLRDYLLAVSAQMPTLSDSDNDADSDALPDDWEFSYLLGTQYDASDDPDGDNITNANEYAQGTDPLVFDESILLANQDEFQLGIYPNPCQEILHIHLPHTSLGHSQMSLYTLGGQLVLSEQLSGGANKLSLASLPTGVYYYRLADHDKISTGKLVKR